jgi:predicted ABC-type ATPase
MAPAKPAPARLYVLAGVNGAGKSSIGGAAIRAFGGDYYNPDEAARALNAAAWQQGKRLLERAVRQRLDFAFETTLGGTTMPRLLAQAAAQRIEVRVWYVGLSSPELHIERVRQRVQRGGHDIAEADIRRRYEHSRLNLVQLLPALTALRIYDNSIAADLAAAHPPEPRLVLHLDRARIVGPADLSATPPWAKPIVAAAIKLGRQG